MTPDRDSRVSVVIPVYRNADTLRQLGDELRAALAGSAAAVELVFVNDASPDESSTILDRLSVEDPNVIVVSLPINVGQQHAILTGLKRASGDIVIVMDADLQDPSAAAALLIARLTNEASEAVFATRTGLYQSHARMMTSWLFKSALSLMTGLPLGAGCFVVMTRLMTDTVIAGAARDFYLPAAISRAGLKIGAIPVARNRRASGKSAYSATARLKLALKYLRSIAFTGAKR